MKKPVPGIHHAAICTADVERSMKFWRDGLGFTELFDQTFTGDWPELFGAKNNRLRSIFLGDPRTPDTGIVELVVFEDADAASAPPARPRHGFFLLSPQREVETTLVLWRRWGSVTAFIASPCPPRVERRSRWRSSPRRTVYSSS